VQQTLPLGKQDRGYGYCSLYARWNMIGRSSRKKEAKRNKMDHLEILSPQSFYGENIIITEEQ
jgi:hypothetical protein